MKKYRVLVRVTQTYALDVLGADSACAVKVAKNRDPHSGVKVGFEEMHYEVVDNEFDTTN